MGLLDLVFPPRCLGCDSPMGRDVPLCDDCLPSLFLLPTPTCSICALPLAEEPEHEPVRCDRCRIDPPPFVATASPFAFAGAMAEAIPRFKYRDRPELAEPLANLCWEAHRPLLSGIDLVVPVPLHTSRLRERGYDQAWLLARHIAQRAQIEARPRALRRIRATSAQVGTSAHERAENLRGAFQPDGSLAGLAVALVDDVVTTTGTVRESAAALRQAGAREVRVLSIARAF